MHWCLALRPILKFRAITNIAYWCPRSSVKGRTLANNKSERILYEARERQERKYNRCSGKLKILSWWRLYHRMGWHLNDSHSVHCSFKSRGIGLALLGLKVMLCICLVLSRKEARERRLRRSGPTRGEGASEDPPQYVSSPGGAGGQRLPYHQPADSEYHWHTACQSTHVRVPYKALKKNY